MKSSRPMLLVAVLLLLAGAFLLLEERGYFSSRQQRLLRDIARAVADRYVNEVRPEQLWENAARGMTDGLDPYTQYIPPARTRDLEEAIENSLTGIGVQLEAEASGAIRVVTPVEDSPAAKAGVATGDRILEIDGHAVTGETIAKVSARVRGEEGSRVKLRVEQDALGRRDLVITRKKLVLPTVFGVERKADNKWNYLLDPQAGIAYVRISQFTPSTSPGLGAALTGLVQGGMRGLVMDLRFNPGGQMNQALEVIDLFVSEGVMLRSEGRNQEPEVFEAKAAGTLPPFPMIVLINHDSASAAEIVAGSLQDHLRARLVGGRSYGKGSIQSIFDLPRGQGAIKMTTAHYFLPGGRRVERGNDPDKQGIAPDVAVAMTPEEEKALREAWTRAESLVPPGGAASRPSRPQPDPQLQRAIDILRVATARKAAA